MLGDAQGFQAGKQGSLVTNFLKLELKSALTYVSENIWGENGQCSNFVFFSKHLYLSSTDLQTIDMHFHCLPGP